MNALLELLNHPLLTHPLRHPLGYYQVVALLLLGLGLFGVIWRRSLVGMLVSVELMLNGAGLSIVAASQLTGADAAKGQLAALLVMGLAAAEATLVLAITLVVFRRFGNVESDQISELRG
jgi:NADH-quinone oxidoreductase subunit K